MLLIDVDLVLMILMRNKMADYDLDTCKVVNKVYHIDKLHKMLSDIIIDYVNQVVLMSDNELNEDRSHWIKNYGRNREDTEDEIKYITSIHTIAIELEQLRRYKEIVYVNPKQITE